MASGIHIEVMRGAMAGTVAGIRTDMFMLSVSATRTIRLLAGICRRYNRASNDGQKRGDWHMVMTTLAAVITYQAPRPNLSSLAEV